MNQELLKEIDRELQAIARDYDVKSWDGTSVDKLDPAEAYNRGYYRALQSVKQSLTNQEG